MAEFSVHTKLRQLWHLFPPKCTNMPQECKLFTKKVKKNHTKLQFLHPVWFSISTWQISSPQALVVMLVTNIRFVSGKQYGDLLPNNMATITHTKWRPNYMKWSILLLLLSCPGLSSIINLVQKKLITHFWKLTLTLRKTK